MNEQEKWDYIISLDEEFLIGGVILSEWSTLLIKDAETAFCNDANLAAILASVAAIESHLRYEYSHDPSDKDKSLFHLIETAPIPTELKINLHKLRQYRNKWVHVKEPENDGELLNKPDYIAEELEDMARFAIRILLQTIYLEQLI